MTETEVLLAIAGINALIAMLKIYSKVKECSCVMQTKDSDE
jgi:hypothetical protein